MKKIVFLIMTVMLVTGCSDNTRTRQYGGTTNITLERGQKLMDIKYDKFDNIWFLTRKMTASDVPECYKFKEKSRIGLLEGTINICEQK